MDAAREDYEYAAPSAAGDDAEVARWARYLMLSASPGAAITLLELWAETDVRSVLPSVRVPTLVLTRSDTPRDHPRIARWVADTIPEARLVEFPGRDLAIWIGEVDPILDEVEAFITGVRAAAAPDRMLATILFTDIVGSTEKAAELGDAAWKELLDRHHEIVRGELARFRGRQIDTAGDGVLAMFDGPARAVSCARSIASSVRDLGIRIRAGVHTGEVELTDHGLRGIAVHIGARIVALADADEVLVSSTVRDLVAGSGLMFEEAGEHELKGVPDRWRLYRVVTS
jgi:class 3 adenylate cyclase